MNGRLTQRETEQMASRLVALMDAGQPIVEGLRAAGRDTGSRRLENVFGELATSFQQGKDWPQAMQKLRRLVPDSLRAAVQLAAGRTSPGEVMACYAERQSLRRQVSGQLRRTIRYPLLIVLLATMFCILYVPLVIAKLAEATSMMGPISDVWMMILWWSNHRWDWVWIGGALIGGAMIFRLTASPAVWRSCVRRTPLVGPVRYWLGLAEWCRWMSLLTEHNVELDEAFRQAGEAAGDAEVGAIGRRASSAATDGQPLDAIVEKEPAIPRSLIPFFRRGEQMSQYPEAFSAAGQCLEERVRGRLLLLQAVAAPMAFTYFGLVIVTCFGWLLIHAVQSAAIV